jgi:hypothetical protein
MLRRLRGSLFGLGRRVSAVGSGFVDTFLRDNKVIPTVLALLALLVFAWIVAGAFFGGPDEEQVSNRAEVAQTQDPAFADPPAPEVENRDADSYAAYQFKDPFRQLVAPAETTAATPTPPSGPPADGGRGGAGGGGDGDAGGGGLDSSDSDGDGLGDQREFDLGLDPANPDSDGDGILDGRDDEARGGASRGGAGRDGAGGTGYTGGRNGAEDDPGAGGGGGRTGQNGDDLPESGGELLLR